MDSFNLASLEDPFLEPVRQSSDHVAPVEPKSEWLSYINTTSFCENPQGSILLIDAYDSFSFNISAMLEKTLSVHVTIIKIDAPISHNDFRRLIRTFDAIVVGPGPGSPETTEDVGIGQWVWTLPSDSIMPSMGICLGFQSLCSTYGASISELPAPRHGQPMTVHHCKKGVFANMDPFHAINYNSLEVKLGLPIETNCKLSIDSSNCWSPSQRCPELKPLAWVYGEDGKSTLSAVGHCEKPFMGVQFHPESCESDTICEKVLQNFWGEARHWNARAGRAPCIRHFHSNGIDWNPPKPRHGPALALREELLRLTCDTRELVYQTCLPKGLLTVSAIVEFFQLFLLDSVVLESAKGGRYSIIPFPSRTFLRLEYVCGDTHCTIQDEPVSEERRRWPLGELDIMEHLAQFMEARKMFTIEPDNIPFWGGFLGYLSYEVGLQRIGVATSERTEQREDMPDVNLLWVERSVVVDHIKEEVWIQTIRNRDALWLADMNLILRKLSNRLALTRLEVDPSCLFSRFMDRPPPESHMTNLLLQGSQISLPDEHDYKEKVEQCKRLIKAGESYELCLTAETKVTMPTSVANTMVPWPIRAWLLYKHLRKHNAAPFSAFVQLGNVKVLSSSPEQFLTWNRDCVAEMVPMKGTLKKRPGMTVAHASSVLLQPKDYGENLMIADLIRHDLYSAGARAVEVVGLMKTVEHETVYQLVSHFRARAYPPEWGWKPEVIVDVKRELAMKFGYRVLQKTLPPGSMTGAPKKRSCELLNKLEQRPRGIYSGVLGYLDVGGGGSFSVCIRTAFSCARPDQMEEPETWHIGAGGAVTALSTAEGEWNEMKTKLDSVLNAFRPRENGVEFLRKQMRELDSDITPRPGDEPFARQLAPFLDALNTREGRGHGSDGYGRGEQDSESGHGRFGGGQGRACFDCGELGQIARNCTQVGSHVGHREFELQFGGMGP